MDSPSIFYDHGDPTPDEQLMLELINRARNDPFAEGQRHGLTILDESRPPAAMNAQLYNASYLYSEIMNNMGQLGHSVDGTTVYQRIEASGYSGTYRGEIVAKGIPTDLNISYTLFGLCFADELHRDIILGLNDWNQEMGIAFYDSYLTMEFCHSSKFGSFLMGVVFNDSDGDNFYDIGEGIEGAKVMPNNGSFYTYTSNGGGYALPITSNGSLGITISQEGKFIPITKTIDVSMNGNNIKVDFNLNESPITTTVETTTISSTTPPETTATTITTTTPQTTTPSKTTTTISTEEITHTVWLTLTTWVTQSKQTADFISILFIALTLIVFNVKRKKKED